jgi:signal transduction histidine kinase
VDDWHQLRLGPPVLVGGQAYLCSGVRLRAPRAGAGGILLILFPEALWRDARWAAVRPSLTLGGCAGALAVALAFATARRLSRRIGALEQGTRRIAAGDFTPLEVSGPDDELNDLGRSVNEMAARLARLQETAQKNERLRLLGQVSGGLAHQLRNGVTGARLAIQLQAREGNGTAPEPLRVALRQLDLVETGLKRFLDLGRADRAVREACDLGALLDEVVSLLRPQCGHTNTGLRWQRPDRTLAVRGDPGQLRHLFHNLLANAVEAAGPGGTVAVSLQPGLNHLRPEAVITVADSGPGPPLALAERVFEPFVTGKPEGVGLGLAVARQVVETHGGTIGWHREGGQTCFRVVLPLEPPPCPTS